jgi:hypothetical protein
MLINLALAAFSKAGWPTSLETGRYIFKNGDDQQGFALTPSN